MLRWDVTLVANAADTDSVAASQTPAGAGALTLTATTVTFGSGSAQKITITSGDDISNRTFTIVGTDPNGDVLSEVVTGPDTDTVSSVYYYKSVTSVTISGAAAGAVTVGNAADAATNIFPPDMISNPFSIGMGCRIVGGTTPTYSIQHTFQDIQTTDFDDLVWFTHSVIVDKTANQDGNYDFPVNGIRLIITAAGTVAVNLLQGGGGFR